MESERKGKRGPETVHHEGTATNDRLGQPIGRSSHAIGSFGAKRNERRWQVRFSNSRKGGHFAVGLLPIHALYSIGGGVNRLRSKGGLK